MHPLSNTKTGLEITPLRSYLEGPFRIVNVSVKQNVFVGMKKEEEKELVTVCEGMSHQRAKDPWSGCQDVIVAHNTYKELLL